VHRITLYCNLTRILYFEQKEKESKRISPYVADTRVLPQKSSHCCIPLHEYSNYCIPLCKY